MPLAHITLTLAGGTALLHCETDAAGRCLFKDLEPSSYSLQLEKAGFYKLSIKSVNVAETNTVDAVMTHEQEIKESINVVESPPAIDANQTATSEDLTSREILNVPYPTSRDIRNALPLMPGVIRDQEGAVHVAGSSIQGTLTILDGFNIGLPTDTFANLHVSTDAVRSLEVESSSYSAEYGKGTSLLGMATGIGDDKFRFSATNFIPSFQTKKGLSFNQWVPRAAVSGPIRKGKAWFFDSPDAEYSQTIVPELPDGADRAHSWRVSNLAKVQVNITPTDIFSTELLINSFHADNAGLSPYNPIETTINDRESAWMAAARYQHYFTSGALAEAGFAIDQFDNHSTPLGSVPYVMRPGSASGSFFEATRGHARRAQSYVNVYLAPRYWHGRHDLKFGLGADRLTYARDFLRSPIHIVRNDGTLARLSTFSGSPYLQTSNFEGDVYGQDRWSPTDRLLIESGVRFDWDQIIRQPLLSPRLAASYMVEGKSQTKITGGVGLFYEATNLDLIGRPMAGTRYDTFYGPDGTTALGPPVLTQFFVDRSRLQEPRYVISSIGVERKLPGQFLGNLQFIDKRTGNAFAYVNRDPTKLFGNYDLHNNRSERYDALMLSVRHDFRGVYPFLFSYTRSAAHTSELLDFNLDTPATGFQQAGPLPWDTPNRVLSWGWAPFFKKTTLGYSLEWRDGYPLTAVDALQEVAGQANSYRYPYFFSLTVSLEKRFHLLGRYLALRATVENITNRHNPIFVDNNIDSPNFLQFEGTGHRAFTARIRLLGRTKSAAKANAVPTAKP